MKNVYKSFALLCMGFAAVACVEEPFEDVKIDTTSGNEIVFTATSGSGTLITKTEYGDVSDGKIAVHWKHGDKIQIASPEAIGTNSAEYMIGTAVDPETGEYPNSSQAASLTKTGNVGLQWSSSPSHSFYAMYPSPATTISERDNLDYINKYVVAHIPSEQKELEISTIIQDGIKHYVYKPDMSYAYMVARDSYESGNNDDEVTLQFSPVFTALRFDLSIPEIGTSTLDKNIWLKSVKLSSAKNQLSGDFKYNFEDETTAISDTQFDEGNSVSINFGEFFALAEDEVCSVTLFILPTHSWEANSGDLELTVEYLNSGKVYTKSAKIGAKIEANKMHHFKNVQLPKIGDVEGGSWVESLDPETPIAQLSIPIAGNVFANTNSTLNYGVAERNSQQEIPYDALWRLGVRGFEFVTQTTGSSQQPQQPAITADGLKNSKMVCSEVVLNDAPSFGTAFETLVGYFVNDVNTNEFLILLCTYQAASDIYNPDRFVKELVTYFETGQKLLTKDKFVRITSETKVKDLYGKVAVIVRPGDDDRYKYESNSPVNSDYLTSKIPVKSLSGADWADNVAVVTDWGTAFDVWDRRYEVIQNDGTVLKVARESTFETNYYHGQNRPEGARPAVENWLFGQSTSGTQWKAATGNNNYNAFNNYGSTAYNKPTLRTEGFDYEHPIIDGTLIKGGKAYVQEWTRVVPSNFPTNETYTGYSGSTSIIFGSSRYLWVKWPESISEKKIAIDQLFLKSVQRDLSKNDIFINVLSGYYVINATKDVSMLPFHASFQHISGVANQGKGGQYKELAKDLNEYVFGILSGSQPLTKTNSLEDDIYLPQGPWGMIVIDHIHNSGTSANLVNLIMMNNFKSFINPEDPEDPEDELTTPSAAWAGDYDSAYLDGENAISFE